MPRHSWIISITVIITFILVEYFMPRFKIAESWTINLLLNRLFPILAMMGCLAILHRPHRIWDAWGLRAAVPSALGRTLLWSLPMLVGYGAAVHFNLSINEKMLVGGILIAPIFEELVFRGFLFGQLFRYGGWGFIPAGLLNAVIFASLHLYQADDWSGALGVLAATGLGGLWFAWLYVEWNYNLWVSIFMHLFMNAWWMLFSAGEDAGGGWYANIFRGLTIALSVIVTIRYKKYNGGLLITRRNWWRNEAADLPKEHSRLHITAKSSFTPLVMACCCLPAVLQAQVHIEGRVFDEQMQALAYVNIGVTGTAYGTVSDPDGSYQLILPQEIGQTDTVRFSAVGYAAYVTTIEELQGSEGNILLKNSTIDLPTVIVRPDNRRLKTLGNDNTGTSRSVNLALAKYPNQNLGAAVGRKFALHKPSQLETLRFFVQRNSFDTVRFRINIDRVENGRPGASLLSKPVIIELKPKQSGWIEVDLQPYDIKVEDPVIISVEWVYARGEGRALSMPITIPAIGATHYYRYGSQNKWKKFAQMSSCISLTVRY